MIYTNMIKYMGIALMTTFFVIGCGQQEKEPSTMTVEELKSSIKVKKTKLRKISTEIDDFQEVLASKDSTVGPEVFNVTVDTARLSDFSHYVNVQGVVKSDEEVSVSAEVGGSIVDLKVEEGQYIRSGKLIAKLDVESMRSQKKEVESQYELAKDLYERQKKLWNDEIGSEVQYLEAKNRKENLEKRLETLEVNLSKSNVYATSSGTVESIRIDEGEYAAPGAPILNLLNGNNLKVVAEVPESYIKDVSKGKEIKVKFPTLDTSQITEISLVGSIINSANRTIKIEAPIQLDNEKHIKPNMLVMVYIQDFQKKDVIKVASPIVQQEVSGKNYILLAEKVGNEKFQAVKKYVKTGPHFNNQVIIEKGVVVGDLIIDSGARGLAVKSHLNILSDKEATDLFSQSNTTSIDG